MEDFEKIYREYYDTVFGYSLSLCRNADLARDITRETFLRALEKIGTFRGESKISVWLCRIAKNLCFSAMKKCRRETPAEWRGFEENPEETAVDGLRAEEILSAADRLPPPRGEVFRLRAAGGMSFRDIARLYGKTESWARVTYHRAKLKIREETE